MITVTHFFVVSAIWCCWPLMNWVFLNLITADAVRRSSVSFWCLENLRRKMIVWLAASAIPEECDKPFLPVSGGRLSHDLMPSAACTTANTDSQRKDDWPRSAELLFLGKCCILHDRLSQRALSTMRIWVMLKSVTASCRNWYESCDVFPISLIRPTPRFFTPFRDLSTDPIPIIECAVIKSMAKRCKKLLPRRSCHF